MRTLLACCLLALAAAAQLPPVPVPPENPITPAKVVLGKILFWEEQLSSDDTVACATCHLPEQGGADGRLLRPGTPVHPGLDQRYGTPDDVRGSPGVVNQDANLDFQPLPPFGLSVQVTPRLTPSAIGAGYHALLFWDGRAFTRFTDPETNTVAIQFDGALESQALGPIMNPVEMGHQGRTWSDVRQKLQQVEPLALCANLTPDIVQALAAHPTYPDLFAAAFGDGAITARRIAFAIASYERVLVPDQSPWDRFANGDPLALGPVEQNGLAIFMNQGRCAVCHPPPLFSDDVFHNLGNRPWHEDAGRMLVTTFFADRGAFKTPSLRNVGLRPRGFHDGSMPQLGTAAPNDPNSMVNFYLFGGGPFRDNLDPFMIDLSQAGVTAAMLQDVEAFLRHGLTDPRVQQALPPFDHPTLRSMQPTTLPHHFGTSLPGAISPFLVDALPLFLGHRGYRLGLAASPGSSAALLAFGLSPQPLPVSYLGIPFHIVAAHTQLFVLGGGPVGPAHLTWHLAIPNDPGLARLDLYAQLFVFDPSAPGSLAASQGHLLFLR